MVDADSFQSDNLDFLVLFVQTKSSVICFLLLAESQSLQSQDKNKALGYHLRRQKFNTDMQNPYLASQKNIFQNEFRNLHFRSNNSTLIAYTLIYINLTHC